MIKKQPYPQLILNITNKKGSEAPSTSLPRNLSPLIS